MSADRDAASLPEPTTREVADTLMSYAELLAWADEFQATPFNMLPLATVAAKAAGPLLVMRSLFALAAERERLAAESLRLAQALRLLRDTTSNGSYVYNTAVRALAEAAIPEPPEEDHA